MTTLTKEVSTFEAINSGIDAEAIEIAWRLTENKHAVNKQLEEDVCLFEFADVESCEDYTFAAVAYINRCLELEAEISQPCTVKSTLWQHDAIPVFLPTIEVRFNNGLQVEGQLLSDDNGKPYGVLVIDCDKRSAKLLETVLRF